jgi:hypothetical protein
VETVALGRREGRGRAVTGFALGEIAGRLHERMTLHGVCQVAGRLS